MLTFRVWCNLVSSNTCTEIDTSEISVRDLIYNLAIACIL